jgi:RNA polymerase sigma factor (sigma-70 family)
VTAGSSATAPPFNLRSTAFSSGLPLFRQGHVTAATRAACHLRAGGRACHRFLMDEIRLLLVKLRRLLHRRGRSADDMDDLIQEAFLRLQLYCRENTVHQPEAFLVRTVLNLSADLRKRERRAGIVPGALETLPLVDPAPTPDVACASLERLQHLKAGLRSMRPRRREVFILSRIEGYSYPQIARRLGISPSMVEKHVAKAALFLAQWMDEEQDEPPT